MRKILYYFIKIYHFINQFLNFSLLSNVNYFPLPQNILLYLYFILTKNLQDKVVLLKLLI